MADKSYFRGREYSRRQCGNERDAKMKSTPHSYIEGEDNGIMYDLKAKSDYTRAQSGNAVICFESEKKIS